MLNLIRSLMDNQLAFDLNCAVPICDCELAPHTASALSYIFFARMGGQRTTVHLTAA